MRFKSLDIIKANSILLYITKELERIDKSDFLTIFKILYFADQKHLVKYGRPILTDNYIAMNNGPVPSAIYDFFKILRRGGYKSIDFELMSNSFTCEGYYIYSAAAPDMDLISKSEFRCIDESLAENKHLPFKILSNKSHDSAWKKTIADAQIDVIEIAKAGGANDEMIKYILLKEEEESFNSQVF